jgi:hypothetical protein
MVENFFAYSLELRESLWPYDISRKKFTQSRKAAKPRSREAAKPQSREAAKPRSRKAAKPQSREAAKQQSREAAKPQSREAAKPQHFSNSDSHRSPESEICPLPSALCPHSHISH